MLSLEGPLEKLCREGRAFDLLKDRLVSATTVETIIANSLQTRMTPYGEQDGNGIDVSLIRQAMRLSVTERIRISDLARRGTLEHLEHAQRST